MKSRLKVLFLTHRLPYAPNRGDRTRAFHILRALTAEADVTLASLVHDGHEAGMAAHITGPVKTITAPVPRFANYGRALVTLASDRPLTTALLYSPSLKPQLEALLRVSAPDVVLAFCSSMGRFALEPPLDRLPVVLDMVDADSAKWSALASRSGWPKSWIFDREARTLAAFESTLMKRAFATLAVNDREVSYLARLSPESSISVLQNGVDVAAFRPPQETTRKKTVVFTGVMNYLPNEEAAHVLVNDIWPLVLESEPDAELRVVGSSPTRRVQALSRNKSVVVTGSVPDIRPELWSASVAVAPLAVARGVQNKVLEAVAAGLPCVVTTPVHEGLPVELSKACKVADAAPAFAKAVVELLRMPAAQRLEMASVDLTSYGWDARLAGLLPILQAAAQNSV